MAITLRGIKGTPLTQEELDVNFTEFFYSASAEGSSVIFHRYHYDSSSANPSASIEFPIDPPQGLDGYIQLKKGNALSGTEATHTASANLRYDYNNNLLEVNGQLNVTGSSNITGDLIVGGIVTAQEFKSQLVSSSIVYKSGSTKFGDSADDVHNFTGSTNMNGNANISGILTITGIPNVRTSIDDLVIDSGSFSTRVTANESDISNLQVFSSSLDDTYATDTQLNASSSALITLYTAADTALSSSTSIERTANSSSLAASITALSSSAANTYLKNTTDTLNGNLTVTGTVTAQEFNTEYISSSVIYESGSTKFGDSIDDQHTFTGSVDIDGRLGITGFADVSASLASLVGNSGIQNIVEDTTPQLGGNLALNSNSITGTGNIDITGEVTASALLINGTITSTGDITAFASSDKRLKDNITPISDATSKLSQIGGYEFDWNSNSSHSGHDVGVIAQEIEKVLPEIVVTRDNGYKAVRYEKIVALLIEAVKEQQLQINELKSKL